MSNIPKDIQKKIDDAADKHGFQVPFDGTNNFYGVNKVESFQAGAIYGYSLAIERIEGLERQKAELIEVIDTLIADSNNQP